MDLDLNRLVRSPQQSPAACWLTLHGRRPRSEGAIFASNFGRDGGDGLMLVCTCSCQHNISELLTSDLGSALACVQTCGLKLLNERRNQPGVDAQLRARLVLQHLLQKHGFRLREHRIFAAAAVGFYIHDSKQHVGRRTDFALARGKAARVQTGKQTTSVAAASAPHCLVARPKTRGVKRLKKTKARPRVGVAQPFTANGELFTAW